MMKMFLSVFVWVMLLASVVSANPYANDKNFAYVYYNSYLDLRTVSVQKNSPPYFIVEGDIVHVDTKSNTASLYADITIKFDLLAHRTFHHNNKTGNWKLGNTFGTSSEETSNRKIADALFKAAFGREFYGENFSRNRFGINESVPALSMNRLALGGIQIGASFERVRSIYGSPNNVKRLVGRDLRFWDGNSGEVWSYGNSFEITFIDGTVRLITSKASNGIKTADGISVGDDAGKLWRTYGRAYKSMKNAYLYRNSFIYLKFTMSGEKISEISIFVDG